MPHGNKSAASSASVRLPDIPLLNVGPDFALETALAVGETRGYAMLDRAMAGVSPRAVRIGDALSRAWLRRSGHPYLAEIDALAAIVVRPGTYYFNVHYEWGCTTAAKPAGDGQGMRLVRVLDWKTPGLGRHIVAARVMCPKGPWVTLTWPGYTGVLQAVAKGRFAAAINQAPARTGSKWPVLDWASAKSRIWQSRAITPAHLLRRVFERASDYAEARAMLSATPVAAPVIYTLAGPLSGQGCVIERLEEDARMLDAAGAAQASNDWQSEDWKGPRRPGRWSAERLAAMRALADAPGFERPFEWLCPPMLNEESRLAIVADPASGKLVAQGFESDGPATAVLELST